jgi:ATP-dependent 26S proteasome regulatory subunit
MKEYRIDIQYRDLNIDTNSADCLLLNSRLKRDLSDFMEKSNVDNIRITIDNNLEKESEEHNKVKPMFYDPVFQLSQLVIEDETLSEILYSIKSIEVSDFVFNTWGLKRIEPYPKVALNFFGESGTGKTMAAHAIASELKLKICPISYAEIESKYHGEGPKNVREVFSIANNKNVVLFIDEADSLLSKRLLNVTQGSEQAINSMRSQLLIEIEKYCGIVIFATNFVQNYDKAFTGRIKSIEFKRPNERLRRELWEKYLSGIPISKNKDILKLAKIEGINGRDIKNAVVSAAIKSAIDKLETVSFDYIISEIKKIISMKKKLEQHDENSAIPKVAKDKIRKVSHRE